MEAQLCNEVYSRPSGYSVRCTYIEGHPGHKHSWEALKVQDEADAEQEREMVGIIGHDDKTPEDVRALLDAIAAGNADPYLEAILAVTHNRKRYLRRTPGFGMLRGVPPWGS